MAGFRQWLHQLHRMLHVHNIFLDTLGRYGVFTAVLFTVMLASVLIIAFISVKTFNIGLYIFTFILIGMFEYNYLFMFLYFSQVVLLFVVGSYLITVRSSRSIDESARMIE